MFNFTGQLSSITKALILPPFYYHLQSSSKFHSSACYLQSSSHFHHTQEPYHPTILQLVNRNTLFNPEIKQSGIEVSASFLQRHLNEHLDCIDMGKRRVSAADNDSSRNKEKSWFATFELVLRTIKDQQQQLEKFEKVYKSQQDRWISDVKRLEDCITQMKRDARVKDMSRMVDAAKADLFLSMKQKEAIMNKLKFEEADDERADLRLVLEEVLRCKAEPKEHVTRSNSKGVDESALKVELNFAWNQFKRTDDKLQKLIAARRSEVESANKKEQKLIADFDHLQALNMEKDQTIASLKEDIVALEFDSRKKDEEIAQLKKQLELLRGDSTSSMTPVLRRCMVESSTRSHSGDMAIVEKQQGVRSSRRKAKESEPRLFTSKFKVPKLKR